MELLGWEYRIAGQDVESLRHIPLARKNLAVLLMLSLNRFCRNISLGLSPSRLNLQAELKGLHVIQKGMYAVNLGRQGTIGMVSLERHCERAG